MEQETQNSGILNAFANLFDPQSRGSQNAQSNNNNSNLRISTLAERNRVESTAAQAMNAHLLSVTGQLSSGVPNNNGPASDSTLSELDVLTNETYPFSGDSTNAGSQDALYEAANQIGIATDVGNVLEQRMATYAPSMMDFPNSQNQHILEAFNTIETSAAVSLPCAQSYVSLLHQQQPGDIWSSQMTNAGGNFGNKQQLIESRPLTNQQNAGLGDSSVRQQVSLQKSTGQISHPQRQMPINHGGQRPQQYDQNSMMQYDMSNRLSNKNHNPMSLTVNDGLQFSNDIRGSRGREKKLTTTPIPSDADKSSCSSTSSDGISGPEHSPDHISDRPPSSISSMEHHTMDNTNMLGDNITGQHGKQKRENGQLRNVDTSKNYPCYGNMNLVNFGTINFAPVMENSSLNPVEASRSHQQPPDGSMPLPTSDSIVEIGDTVTSPLENIPMSPTTPTGTEIGGSSSCSFNDIHNMHSNMRGSYAQMQTVTTVHTVGNGNNIPNSDGRKSKTRQNNDTRKMLSNTTRPADANNNKLPQNNYSKNFTSLSTVTPDKLQEKQKKSRSSKHKHHASSRRGEFNDDVNQYKYSNNQAGHHLKPKMNADPMVNTRHSFEPNSHKQTGDNIPQLALNENQMKITQSSKAPSYSSQTTPNGHCITPQVPVTNTSSNSSQSRVWQTVTAVQGKKLPPVLSEQDRIPKRGRPSKKMMQQNLKVKAASSSAAASQPSSTVTIQKSLPPPSVPPTSQSPGLVAMYTINKQGVIEEICPKPKESRRSKERNQAFLKYLDEIKMSSKNRQTGSVKTTTNEGEKPKKKTSRPRNKVFGRQNAQPLTESGITETMCTFSALAHRYKISNSILERATENLLKSAANKRNKEQGQQALSQLKRRSAEKSSNVQSSQPEVSNEPVFTNNNTYKTLSVSEFNHCENNISSSAAKVNPLCPATTSTTIVQEVQRQESSKPADKGPTTEKISNRIGQKQPQIASKVTNDILKCTDTRETLDGSKKGELSPESLAVPLSPDGLAAPSDSNLDGAAECDEVEVKGKHKKKKQKKHKKHKHSDPGSAKKKKKDKEKKKKLKKKEKAKLSSSITPSASVSLMKSNVTPAAENSIDASQKLSPVKIVPASSKIIEDTSWPMEDNTYDSDDSSSDEVTTSPKSCLNIVPFSSAISSSIPSSQPSFAQYSQSRIGFGTFSMEKSPPRISDHIRNSVSNSCSAIVPKMIAPNATFGSQPLLRPNKKHARLKKKKLSRKSKACDPAFIAILDQLVVGLGNMKLDTKKTLASPLSLGNVFLSTGLNEISTSSLSLWRSPNQKPTKKSPAFITSQHKSSMFHTDRNLTGFGSKNADFRSMKSKTSPLESKLNGANSISVFCSAPFFQKHGYVAPDNSDVNKTSLHAKSTPESTKANDGRNTVTPKRSEKKKQGNDAIDQSIQEKNAKTVSAVTESEEKRTEKVTKKRGWPRGKPRKVPRGKRRKLSETLPVEPKPIESQSMVRDEAAKAPVTSKDDVSRQPNDTDVPGVFGSASVSDLVNDTLLKQIKQAIEANLPKHPSVNKDAIAKSVDAAVQSYLQTLTKEHSPPENSNADEDNNKPKKKPARRKSKNESVSEPNEKVPDSSKSNSDIHPKKIWAFKHQDTETSVSKSSSNTVVQPIKRGRGRPRKYPLTNPPSSAIVAQLSTPVNQRKVPTASATLVPSKRKVLTVKLSGRGKKSSVKKLIARAKTDSVKRNLPTMSLKIDSTVTREAAISCLSALCSIKAAKVLAKSSSKDEDSKISMYAGTEIDCHITESIDYAVDMYSWDNYKQYNDACRKVAEEMGFGEDSDSTCTDSRSKNQAVKKSLESVVAKLKNKRSMESDVPNTLLELHNTSEDEQNEIISDFTIVNPQSYSCKAIQQNDNGEKASSHVENSTQVSRINKVKNAGSLNTSGKAIGVGVPMKRPRGRPKMKTLHDNPPSKKRKLTPIEIRETQSQSDSAQEGLDLPTTSIPLLVRCPEEDPFTTSRKRYLTAGLYSSTYKKDNPESSREDLEVLLSRVKPKLPPPFDAGLFVRNRLNDFQLPYKVWWMYKHEMISASQDPSNTYVEISENIYSTAKPAAILSDCICNCNPEKGEHCGHQCLNRLNFVECQLTTCPCGHKCTNQAMQTSGWCQSLERFKTEDCGWGIKTTETISKGSFILEYVGEVVSEAEFRTRTIELYHAYNNHYCIQLDSSTVIDGYISANEGRYVNHSCEPNCEMQKWCINGEFRVGLFALRNVEPGEELTYDYSFSAFNMDMLKACKCGSQKCRGLIGGRDQRSFSTDSDSSSASFSPNAFKGPRIGKQSKLKAFKSKDDVTTVKDFSTLQMKPIPKKEKEVIRSRQLFLLRNLTQVRRREEEEQRRKMGKKSSDKHSSKSGHKAKSKKNHQSKEDRKKIATAITEMYTAIATCKDQNGVSVAIPFMNLPSKKKNPEYYERISDPIDLSIIERNIVSNHYKDIETFNYDVHRVFKNAEKYHGKKSTLGKDVFRLRKAYAQARAAAMQMLNGHKKSKPSEASDDDLDEENKNVHRKNEDYIRCICQIYRDEGLMVQCEKCFVWQHCDCIAVDPEKTDHYLCEECDPRPVPKEVKIIPPPPNTPHGHTYYLTLMKDDILVKQGDCAYVNRDHRLRNGNGSPVRASHRNINVSSHDKSDIFRIEQLWTDERGDKYAYGYLFLRPHETHHAPSRTFYHNELFASPFYEIIPLEAVVGLCCVMDNYTFCKGKPKDFEMSDLYICDYRTDKAASSFNRITKKKYPICTKPHVFDTYKHKICPRKDYQPHVVPEQYRRSAGRPPSTSDSILEVSVGERDDANDKRSDGIRTVPAHMLSGKYEVGSAAWKKRERLDGIANKLLSKLPCQGDDASYLLELNDVKRHRSKS